MTEAELVERWTAAADELALVFAHEPDAKVDESLARMRQNLNADFLRVFPEASPADLAAGVESIIAEILKRRREIEAGAVPTGALN
jgi:hypothetical protein